MPHIERAFHKVRCELAQHGLLAPGAYLDTVDLYRTTIPDLLNHPEKRNLGEVNEDAWVFKYDVGNIIIPRNAAITTDVGETLPDVIRHEFAHAWWVLDPTWVDGPWFVDTFGATYDQAWKETPDHDAYLDDPEAFTDHPAWRDHVSGLSLPRFGGQLAYGVTPPRALRNSYSTGLTYPLNEWRRSTL